MDFFKNWDDRGSLERSLPVVNWDLSGFFQKLGWSGFLRTLATGSELGFELIFLKLGWSGALRTLATGSELPLRTLTTGSERSKGGFLSLEHPQSCVLLTKTPAKTQDHSWSDVCQPPLRTLTTGSERSNRERPSHPVRTLSILGSVLTGSDGRSLLERSLR